MRIRTGRGGAFAVLAMLFSIFGAGIRCAHADEGAFTTLYSFKLGHGGIGAASGLTKHPNGSFYGNTYASAGGAGTIYRYSEANGLETLHAFNGADGLEPSATMVVGSDDNLYGTTETGGDTTGSGGTIFRMTPEGLLTVLHTFEESEGGSPTTSPIEVNGNFYGVASSGGTDDLGTIYSLTSAGGFTLLHVLSDADGGHPMAALVVGADGNLYGTTSDHGAYGYGTIYRVTPQGDFTVLHDFDGNDGATPFAGLTLGPNGDLYGVTTGFNVSNGTIFKISISGTFTKLYSFKDEEGRMAKATLIVGSDGYFYGMSEAGGINGYGTIFRFAPGSELTVLHTFNGDDGVQMQKALVEGAPGVFYGTARLGGTDNAGTIFKMEPSVPSAPPDVTIAAAPATLQLGGMVMVSWSSVRAVQCEASGAWNGTQSSSGISWFKPTNVGELHYMLTCTGPGGSGSDEVVVTVMPLPTAPVVTLTLSSPSISLGQSSLLSWTSTGADNCEANGSWGGSVGIAGDQTLTPTEVGEFAYSLRCTGDGGSSQAEVTLSVMPPVPLVTLSLSATQITLGESSDLSWTAINATSCVADGSWSGALEISGQHTLTPSAIGQYNYVLRCTGEGGTSQAQTALTVVAPPPELSLAIDRSTIQQDEIATLSWSAQNANSCTASGAWSGTLSVEGSQSISPSAPGQYQYNLICTGNGSVSRSVDLTVKPKTTAEDGNNGGAISLWSSLLLAFASVWRLMASRRLRTSF